MEKYSLKKICIGHRRRVFGARRASLLIGPTTVRYLCMCLCMGMLLVIRCATAHRHVEKAAMFAFVYSSTRPHRRLDLVAFLSSSPSSSSSSSSSRESALETNMENGPGDTITATTDAVFSPWNDPQLQERLSKRKRNNSTRFRQHVNPLARRFQQPTILSDEWPRDVYADCTKDLHIDIGCGKGGFLLDLVANARAKSPNGDLPYNYLGLEIRPGVAQYAKERIAIHKMTGVLEYLGCNANVDLKRVLQRYHDAATNNGGPFTTTAAAATTTTTTTDSKLLKFVSIQYPDPHFKSQHAKRRVVLPSLIDTLARYMPTNGQVFLQSDVNSVLDDMRLRFRESGRYFQDTIESESEYLEDNPLGVPTEREISVLKKGLPVYRSLFLRNDVPYQPQPEQ